MTFTEQCHHFGHFVFRDLVKQEQEEAWYGSGKENPHGGTFVKNPLHRACRRRKTKEPEEMVLNPRRCSEFKPKRNRCCPDEVAYCQFPRKRGYCLNWVSLEEFFCSMDPSPVHLHLFVRYQDIGAMALDRALSLTCSRACNAMACTGRPPSYGTASTTTSL